MKNENIKKKINELLEEFNNGTIAASKREQTAKDNNDITMRYYEAGIQKAYNITMLKLRELLIEIP